ncbi:MAG: GAF domain-containing SpoIIE family protein phosphatase, partial [Spirochaetota bacterium]
IDIFLNSLPAYISSYQYEEAVKISQIFLDKLGFKYNVEEENFNKKRLELLEHLKSPQIAIKIGEEREIKDIRIRYILRILFQISPILYLNREITKLHYASIVESNIALEHQIPVTSVLGIIKFSILEILDNPKFIHQTAKALVKEIKNRRSQSQIEFGMIYTLYANFLLPWREKMSLAESYNRIAFETGIASGNLLFAGYSLQNDIRNLFFCGNPILYLSERLIEYMSFTILKEPGLSHQTLKSFQIIFNLFLDNKKSNMQDIGEHRSFLETRKDAWSTSTHLSLAAQFYYHIGEIDKAYDYIELSIKEGNFIESLASLVVINTYYQTLIYFKLTGREKCDNRQILIDQIDKNLKRFQTWVDHCEENFIHFYLILNACKLAWEKKYWEALGEFDLAIQKAIQNGFIQVQGLANELAGELLANNQKKNLAKSYMTESYRCYEKWNAKIKLKYLRENLTDYFLNKITDDDLINETYQKNLSVQKDNIEIQSIFEIISTISKELKTENLLKKILENLLRFTGGKIGAFITHENYDFYLHAIASEERIEFFPAPGKIITDRDILPMNVIFYTHNSGEEIIIENAILNTNFNNNKYIYENNILSILCIPITVKNQMNTFLYLENRDVENFFSNRKSHILKMILSQVVISIENAQLYSYKEEALQANSQIALANQIQKSLFPHNPHIEGFSIDYQTISKDKIGGDYIDMISKNGKDTIIIGDISGHDLHSGLHVFTLQSCLQTMSYIEKDFTLLETANLINEVLSSNIDLSNEPSSLDATILMYEREEDRFYYCGNNEDFLLYRAKRNTVESIEVNDFLFGYGTLIKDANDFEENFFEMEEGDIAFLYTDGIIDSTSKKKTRTMYSKELLIEILLANHSLPLEKIIEQTIASLKDYNVHDDITLFLIKKNKGTQSF